MCRARKLKLPCIFVYLSICWISAVTSQKAYPNPLAPIWCFPCPPGNYISVHCLLHLTNSSCLPCRDGQYSSTPNNRTTCQQCRQCPENFEIVRPCNSTSDNVCQCRKGFYEFRLDASDPVFECHSHSKCSDGKGEVYPGNLTHDTKCRVCTLNEEFVNRSDPNHPVCQQCICLSQDNSSCSAYRDRECTEVMTSTVTIVSENQGRVPDSEQQHTVVKVVVIVVVIIVIILGVVGGYFAVIKFRKNRRYSMRKRKSTADTISYTSVKGNDN